MKINIKIIIASLLLFLNLKASGSDYKLGEGVQLFSLPIYFGGYTSLDYKQTEDEDKYRFDDLAMLSYGNFEKFSYMLELEYKELYVQSQSKNSKKITQNRKLYTERAYIDYNYNENSLLRIGKYNSPIGFWNLLPINVLRATSSDPVTSKKIFPMFTTGILLSYLYYGDSELKVDIMMQNSDDLDGEYNNYKNDKHYGFGVTYTENDFSFKLNGGSFHQNDIQKDNDEIYYYLLSTKYESDDFQILSEYGKQFSSSKITTNHAGYIQGLYRFNEHHLGIIRVESYDYSANKKGDEEFVVFGYTYRPLYPIALKSEYQLHKNNDLNHILFSLSVLF